MSKRAKALGPKWPRKLKPVRQLEWWERPIADIYRSIEEATATLQAQIKASDHVHSSMYAAGADDPPVVTFEPAPPHIMYFEQTKPSYIVRMTLPGSDV